MKKQLFRNTHLICVMILLLFAVNALFAQENDEFYTISGIVETLSLDEDENVIQVGITSFIEDEEETSQETFIVTDLLEGKELLNLVGETVEVTGTLEYDEDNETTYITVHSYNMIESELNEENEEEDDEEYPVY